MYSKCTTFRLSFLFRLLLSYIFLRMNTPPLNPAPLPPGVGYLACSVLPYYQVTSSSWPCCLPHSAQLRLPPLVVDLQHCYVSSDCFCFSCMLYGYSMYLCEYACIIGRPCFCFFAFFPFQAVSYLFHSTSVEPEERGPAEMI